MKVSQGSAKWLGGGAQAMPVLLTLVTFASERMKREERRREELYRQFFEDIKRRIDAERPVDCSVIVVSKETK